MLLNHARFPARFDSESRVVTLDRQDRGLWDIREIAEGVRVLQSALALQRPGRYQVEAAIAAPHDDAASAAETDWPQILAVLGAAGLRETDRLREVIGEQARWHAVRGHLRELSGRDVQAQLVEQPVAQATADQRATAHARVRSWRLRAGRAAWRVGCLMRRLPRRR